MNIRYPNRTAQAGVFHDGSPATVTLSGAALAGHLPLGDTLSIDDYVGVSVQSQADADAWLVAFARFDGTETLEVLWRETESTSPLSDGAAVDVTVCVTETMLQRGFWRIDPLSVGAYSGPLRLWRPSDPPPDTLNPIAAVVNRASAWREYPDGLTALSGGTTWDGDADRFDHDGTEPTMALAPSGTWADGYRPARVWCELFLPSGWWAASENAPRVVVEDSEAVVFEGARVPAEEMYMPRWIELWCDLALTGDIAQIRVEGLGGASFRVRNIAFDPSAP